jgi:hypothetical protein
MVVRANEQGQEQQPQERLREGTLGPREFASSTDGDGANENHSDLTPVVEKEQNGGSKGASG